jgi:cell division protein FtsQ
MGKILALFVVVGVAMWAVPKLKTVDFLKTKIEWQIDRNFPITQTLLEKTIQSLINDTYLLDLRAIKQALEGQPWVGNATIKRLFFNTIQINISPKKVAMRWENINCKDKAAADCSGYVTDDGVLLIPQKKIKSDAVLARSKVDAMVVSELYQDYQNYQKIAGKMRIISFSKTHIDRLVFSPNIKVILGYQQKKRRLVRFLKAYKKLRKKISKAKLNQAAFDMRYPKAFALDL